MRSRSIRIPITIILILGIAIAALGFKNINIDIPGFPRVERSGTGPLGLKLGLDLRGGGHLVFQADTGTRFDVTFSEDVTLSDLNSTLEELRFGDDDLPLEDFRVVLLEPNRFRHSGRWRPQTDRLKCSAGRKSGRGPFFPDNCYR